jgi:hypothetical protein
MALQTAATRYSKTAVKVESFNDARGVIESTFTNEVANLPLAKFNNDVGPNFNGLFLVDADGIPIESVGDSSVSPKYTPHTREHVFTLLEAARQAFDGSLMVDCRWKNGHVIVIQPTTETAVNVYGHDKIVPKLQIFGGFAGKGFRASLGFYRFLCANMAMLQLVHNVNVNLRHTQSINGKLDALVDQFQTIRESWTATQERIKEMQERKVLVKDVLAQVFGEVPKDGKGKTQAENRIEKVVNRLIREHSELGLTIGKTDNEYHTNGWMMWNAIQGAFQHDFTRKEGDVMLRGLDTWNDATLAKAEKVILAC